MSITAAEVVHQLTDVPPAFHSAGSRTWNALPATLRLLADHLHEGARSVETGVGASTTVFAASGARHTAISPFADEHDRVRDDCAELVASADDRAARDLFRRLG